MTEQAKVPDGAGWKPDPSGRYAGRFWNGTGWTDHVVNRDRVTSRDPSPYPPPPQPRPRQPLRRWTRIALPLAVVAAIAAAVSLSGDGDPPASPVGTGDPTTLAAPSNTIYAVGETARTGDFDVTLFGSRDPQTPGAFLKPAAGNHFVAVDVAVTNRARATRSFSSLLGFHLVDAESRQYDTSFGEITPGAPDGDIGPGEAKRGFVVFEVPDRATGLRLRAQGELTVPGALFALR